MSEQYLFFELAQVALDTKGLLSKNPSNQEWQALYDTCQKQSIAGIVYHALEKLGNHGQKPPLSILYEWIGLNEQIKHQNRIVNQNAIFLSELLNKDGFQCCILKGQGNNLMYPNPYIRTPGDIDVWICSDFDVRYKKENLRKIIKYVKSRNNEGNACYHHIDFGLFHGTEVELHYRPSFMFNPIHNHRLQKWFDEQRHVQFMNRVALPECSGTIAIPTPEFNVIFQLSHVYNHLLHEGIGLRQIIDYYYVLKSLPEGSHFTGTFRKLGLIKIAGAMMWVQSEVLGLEDKFLIAPKDEKRGKIMLEEIMRGGNFGFYDTENKKANTRFKKAVQRFKRDIRLMRFFPSECLWESVFRTYHFFWRMRYNSIKV